MKHIVVLNDKSVMVDGVPMQLENQGMAMLNDVYRSRIGDYPKFFKMDALCKVGFVASELLLKAETDGEISQRKAHGTSSRAVLLFNRSGSLNADTKYQTTIQEADNFFPSPAIFVYTLPNIVTGEIAIRNLYYGETNFIVLDSMDLHTMAEQIANAFQDTETESVLTGWVDCYDENHFEARMLIINRNENILNELNKITQ